MLTVYKKLYILKGKDCTEKVKSLQYMQTNKCIVDFYGSNKSYKYNVIDVVVEELRKEIECSNCILINSGRVWSRPKQILEYKNYYRVVFNNGFTGIFLIERTKIVKSALENKQSRDAFNYYSELASQISPRGDNGERILSIMFEKLISENYIREDSLYSDLTRGMISEKETEELREPILPFKFNPSQKIATENALSSKISIIKGPPGTGKTETILNIISNLVLNGKSVAVVSNNNSAIDNINSKLKNAGLGFLVARLGSKNYKNSFIENQSIVGTNQMPNVNTLSEWVLSKESQQKKEKNAKKLKNSINTLLKHKNEIAQLKNKLSDLVLERGHYSMAGDSQKNAMLHFWRQPSSKNILRIWARLESEKYKKRVNLVEQIYLSLFCGLMYGKQYNIDEYLSEVHINYFNAVEKEIKLKINKLEKKIKKGDLPEKINNYQILSRALLLSSIGNKFLEKPRNFYSEKDLFTKTDEFIEDYPVILSTTFSLRNCLNTNYLYDYVIVDEASQVDMATFALAMTCAKRAVIVGDEKQLPNVVDEDTKLLDNILIKKYSIPARLSYWQNSALTSMLSNFGPNALPTTLLREHYRCDFNIINFCNKQFYNNELIVLSEKNNTKDPLKIYYSNKGNHARSNRVNQRQIDITINEVVHDQKIDLAKSSLGIISPYRNHANKLQEALRLAMAGKTVEADTVDKFQGREVDTIILNTVDNNIGDFVNDPRRLNVAISRAKNQFILVTNGNEKDEGGGVADLIDYIRYNQFEETHSKINSVFDNLYSSYYKHIKNKQKSEFKSEDIMEDLIAKTLENPRFNSLAYLPQYPLNQLCIPSQFKGREKEYAINNNTKIDFLIYKRTSKRAILAVEVDGWKYHHGNSIESLKQQERDSNKNSVLKQLGLPLIRFATNGSGEEKRLEQELEKALKHIR